MPEDPDPCPSSSSSPSSSPSIDPSLNLSPERGETRDKVYMYDKQDIKSPSHFRGGVGEGLDSVRVRVRVRVRVSFLGVLTKLCHCH